MSTQKGNYKRTRPQKYRNSTVFKNDLHDKSNKTSMINNMEVANVCDRCKKIIEWKIKYKKYKALKAPSKCIKCDQKTVKQAYHIMCLPCAKKHNICAKCNTAGDIVPGNPDKQEVLRLDAELQSLLKKLPERKRRTFIRYMNKRDGNRNGKSKEDGTNENGESGEEDTHSVSKEDLLLKLKSLIIKDENEVTYSDDDSDEFI